MHLKVLNILKVFTLLLLAVQCQAQKFHWVKFFGGKSWQNPVSITVDSAGNQYAAFFFGNQIKFDTLTLSAIGNRYNGLVIKQNKDGKVLWYKTISSVGNYDAYPQSCLFNKKGNLIVFVKSDSDIKIGTDTIKKKGKSDILYMLEFNDTGKLINGLQLIEGYSAHGQNNQSRWFTMDKDDNMYLTMENGGKMTVSDSKRDTTIKGPGGIPGTYIIKFSNSGRKFIWSTLVPRGNINMNDLKVDIHGNIYAATDLYVHPSIPFIFKRDTISNPKEKNTGYVLIWDKNGKEKKWFSMAASGSSSAFINLAVHDSNTVFITGMYEGDTARFDTIIKKHRRYGCYYFIAKYHANGRVQWVKTEDTTYGRTFNRPNSNYSFMTNYKDTLFYLSFELIDSDSNNTKPIIFDGQKYNPNSVSRGLNMKVDERGNILWGFRTLSPFNAMGTDDDANLYFQGGWGSWLGGGDTIQFGGFKSKTIDYYPDGYIGKTYDYAIYRGDINKGPYCAGDSFFVPYTKTGEYADTNIFFAEISDEFGNFTGKECEIGRLKSKDSGTIRGVLPMFKVASSGNYRIRIRSTSPQAQSFYKKDALRLLIYSRDKANPGPPLWVCRGDTVQLNTFGGTKWKWSPKYNMDDSNLRQPMIWPIKDTIYKIIISDSSGCGAPDTAFKKIYIRQQLKVVLAFKDTSLCGNITLKIPANFVGGDSNYHWQWVAIASKSSIVKQGSLKQNDTLTYFTNLDSVKTSENIALILWDECSSKRDTAFLTINLRKPDFITPKLNDVTVCNGALLSLQATTNAAHGTYHWQWEDFATHTILSSFDFLKIKATETKKIKLSLLSLCNEDTSVFAVFVKNPLKASILAQSGSFNDTTICYGQSLELNALGQYGDTTSYKFTWYLNQDLVSKADTLTLNSSSTFNSSGEKKMLKLVLDDNCTIGDDSISKIITVIPAPTANFAYDLGCSRIATNFTFTGTKPQNPITTAFNWNLNTETTSTLENPSYLFSTPGTKSINLTLISSNGCRDSFTKTIEIKPQSKADFTANDVCENDSVIFNNTSKDATGYKWKFGDGQTFSTNPTVSIQKHKYNDTITTTYNVTLVALVANGCSDSVVNAVTVNQNPNSAFTFTNTGGMVNLKASKTDYPIYKWTIENTDSITSSNPNYSYTLKTGQKNICLTVTDASGCSSQTCRNVKTGLILGEKQPFGFKIYPNPSSGKFTIEIDNPVKDCLLEVYNTLGTKVGRVERVGKLTVLNLDVAAGIYFVRVQNGVQVWTEKVSVGRDTN